MHKIKAWLQDKVHIITDYYWLILIVALALSYLGLHYSLKLSLQSDLAALLPDNYESVKELKKANDKVGGYETLEILVQGENFEAIKQYSVFLAEELKKSSMVSFIAYEHDVDFYERHALLYIDYDELVEIRDRIQDRVEKITLEYNPFFVDLEEGGEEETEELSFEDFEEKYQVTDSQRYLINKEKTILVIKIFPESSHRNIDFARRFYHEIRSIVEASPPETFESSLFVEYGGNFLWAFS